MRQTVPPPVEEKAKFVPPPARPPRPYDNKVTSLGAREPRRAWGEAAHPSDEYVSIYNMLRINWIAGIKIVDIGRIQVL